MEVSASFFENRWWEGLALPSRQKTPLHVACSFRKTLLVMNFFLLTLLGECIPVMATDSQRSPGSFQPGPIGFQQNPVDYQPGAIDVQQSPGDFGLDPRDKEIVDLKLKVEQLATNSKEVLKFAEWLQRHVVNIAEEVRILRNQLGDQPKSRICAESVSSDWKIHIHSEDQTFRTKAGPIIFGAFSVVLLFCIITLVFLFILHYRNSTRQKVTTSSSD